MPTASVIHVAAGVIYNERGEILLAQRPLHRPQGGLWEFPGGKVERGETALAALVRELAEELGICVLRAAPLIDVPWNYPAYRVRLAVFHVQEWQGVPRGCEGQAVQWVARDALIGREFPAANRAIVAAVRLPDRYAITPAPSAGNNHFMDRLARALDGGVRLLQLRAPALGAADYERLAECALASCAGTGADLLLNAEPALALRLGAAGVHLNRHRLHALRERPLPASHWVAASCHDAAELAHAQRIGVDFAVLGPVLATPSHPAARPLGWQGFAALTHEAALPVYALGGMNGAQLDTARAHGAQGIAAIRALWPD